MVSQTVVRLPLPVSQPLFTDLAFRWPCIVIILIIKSTRYIISRIYFWNKILHVSDSSSFHHLEFFTVHIAMVYVIQLASRIRTEVPSWSCSQAVWHIPLLCVQWKTPDDGQRIYPKHVEFYYKNKFKKLVHLVGFIISTAYCYAVSIKIEI